MAPSEIPLTQVPSGSEAPETSAPPKTSTSGLRQLDIEEASNRYVIHRISMALIPVFIRARVTPNMVSGLGALCGLIAALCYFNYADPVACVAGFLFMVGWHVFDGADGQLARQTGQVSPLGFVIDGVCDYLTFIFVYVALGLVLQNTYGPGIWILVVGSGAFHAVQAAAFEMQREFYQRWTNPERMPPSLKSNASIPTVPKSGPGKYIALGYRFVQQPFRPMSFAMEAALTEQAQDPAQRPAMAAAYAAAFRRPVLAWSSLSANNRTIAIFLFCLAGIPEGYFVYEVVVLSLVLLALLGINAKARRTFTNALSS